VPVDEDPVSRNGRDASAWRRWTGRSSARAPLRGLNPPQSRDRPFLELL
jgi:hypothetical protein